MKKPLQNKRSSRWPALRRNFLKGKVCAVCGKTNKLEAHHIKPFHIYPELELDEKNLIALCEGNKEVNCHLFVGHLGDFRADNPAVIHDARVWQTKIHEAKARIKKIGVA